ncbi:MAG: GspE/PulE/PilB domain-containing protein, partial [Deltaproteobacteria bacterium]
GLVTEQLLAELLGASFDLPVATPGLWAAAGPELADVLPAELAQKHGLAPVKIERRQLTLVAQTPIDLRLIDEIGFLLSRPLRPYVATELRVRLLQQTVYGRPLGERLERLLAGSPVAGPGTEARRRSRTQPQWTVTEPATAPMPPRSLGASEAGEPPREAPATPSDGVSREAPVTEIAGVKSQPGLAERPDPAEAVERIRRATSRDQVVAEAVHFARGAFEFVAVFARRRERLWLFERSGPGADQVDARSGAMSLGSPSVLKTVVEGLAPFIGPVPPGDPLERALGELGRQRLRAVLLYPVVIRDRTVLVLYGDAAGEALAPRQLSDVAWVLSQVGPALERTLLLGKRRELAPVVRPPPLPTVRESAPPPAPGLLAAAPAAVPIPGAADVPAPPELAATPAVTGGPPMAPPSLQLRRRPATLRWGLQQDKESSSTLPKPDEATPVSAPERTTLESGTPPDPSSWADSVEGPMDVQDVQPLGAPLPTPEAAALSLAATAPRPPDAPPVTEEELRGGAELELDIDWEEPSQPPRPSPADLVRTFLAGGAQARAEAEAELARGGAEAAEALCARFPGPLFVFRIAYDELPEPKKLGPVLGLLAQMGDVVVPPLSAVADSAGEEKRYWATVLLAKIGQPICLSPLVRRIFDPAPDVAQAARRGLWHMRATSEFSRVLSEIALELGSQDPARAAQAARALGSMHDVSAVPRLIDLLSSRQGESVDAAVHALREIARQDFGASERRWTSWWSEAKSKPRTAWLIESLEHKDAEIRLAALGELAAATGQDFGYKSDSSPSERAQAVTRWRAWWANEGRHRRLA